MPNDIMTESADDKALMAAIRTETAPPEVTPDPAPAPAPEPAPQPEVKAADPQPEPEPQKKPDERPRLVPHAALHEEREKRKALERRLAELEKPAPAAPKAQEDPIAALEQTQSEVAQLREYIGQQNAAAAFQAKVQPMLAQYQQEHPEYGEQTAHLTAIRAAQLRALGRADHEIAQILRMEANAVFQAALESDRHPGEVVAELAKASGWQPKAAAPAPNPAPAPAPAPVPDIKAAEDRVERLQRGQRAATSSSQTGGASPAANEMSIEQIVNLQGAAFDAAVGKWMASEKGAGRWR
jgi:hypothetical protein